MYLKCLIGFVKSNYVLTLCIIIPINVYNVNNFFGAQTGKLFFMFLRLNSVEIQTIPKIVVSVAYKISRYVLRYVVIVKRERPPARLPVIEAEFEIAQPFGKKKKFFLGIRVG